MNNYKDKKYPFICNYNKIKSKEHYFNLTKDIKPNISNNIFILDSNLNNKLWKSTEYFVEECRWKCNKNGKLSPINFYKSKEFDKYRNLVWYKQRYKALKDKACEHFSIELAIQLIKYFKATKWLDMSAGWGDRLVAAILTNTKYLGSDPNSCLEIPYNKIIKYFSNNNDVKVIKSGFEDLILDENDMYDFFFSSPPFFDLEIYTDEKTQSINKYSNIDSWVDDFMFVSCKKAAKHLLPNSPFILYISNKDWKESTSKLINKIEKELPELQFETTMYYSYKKRPENKKRLFIWRKK